MQELYCHAYSNKYIENEDEDFVGKNHVIQEPSVVHFNFHKKK